MRGLFLLGSPETMDQYLGELCCWAAQALESAVRKKKQIVLSAEELREQRALAQSQEKPTLLQRVLRTARRGGSAQALEQNITTLKEEVPVLCPRCQLEWVQTCDTALRPCWEGLPMHNILDLESPERRCKQGLHPRPAGCIYTSGFQYCVWNLGDAPALRQPLCLFWNSWRLPEQACASSAEAAGRLSALKQCCMGAPTGGGLGEPGEDNVHGGAGPEEGARQGGGVAHSDWASEEPPRLLPLAVLHTQACARYSAVLERLTGPIQHGCSSCYAV